MTSDAPGVAPAASARPRRALAILAMALPALVAGVARAAEPAYPFEGTWVRANRACVANAPRVRTYTAHEVTFPTGHCAFRKVAAGGGQFEVFEDCRRAERPGNYTETIRMLGPDLMQMRRQAARLKIARPLRFTRCTIAAAPPPGTPKPLPGGSHRSVTGAEAPRGGGGPADAKAPADPRP